jgi:hypothetical protein
MVGCSSVAPSGKNAAVRLLSFAIQKLPASLELRLITELEQLMNSHGPAYPRVCKINHRGGHARIL